MLFIFIKKSINEKVSERKLLININVLYISSSIISGSVFYLLLNNLKPSVVCKFTFRKSIFVNFNFLLKC